MTAKKKSVAEEIVIPDRLYFRIGEVAELCRLPAYVLRFWETEFPQLKPVKSNTGQRMYRQRDVEMVAHIRSLLYEQGFTISGARQHLKEESKRSRVANELPFPSKPPREELKRVRQGLRDILAVLNESVHAKRARAKGLRRPPISAAGS
ncbi:MAG: MerR family transcriptional regulator [Terriglobales bacterium]|jgi:DNA-binding transcriptional MerR regulator